MTVLCAFNMSTFYLKLYSNRGNEFGICLLSLSVEGFLMVSGVISATGSRHWIGEKKQFLLVAAIIWSYCSLLSADLNDLWLKRINMRIIAS